jgi:MFS family permease
MSQENKGGNIFAIATMFALFFMIAFVTNFASPMGVIAKNQFNASNALSQLGNAANFIAYLFMGIPGGLILKRKGYKFTALLATAVGFAGVGVLAELPGEVGVIARRMKLRVSSVTARKTTIMVTSLMVSRHLSWRIRKGPTRGRARAA